VDVKVGLRGSGSGKITADGDVSFLHAHNYTVVSRSTIKIEKMAMNCNLTAKSIDSPTAMICGGSTLAFKKIEVRDIGKENYSKTTITIGGKLNDMILSNERDMEIANILRKIHLCKVKIESLNGIAITQTLTRAQEEEAYSFQNTFEQLNDLLEKRKEEKETLRKELRGISLKIIVHGTIYETVHLVMNDVDVNVLESISSIMFTEKDYRITRGRIL
jgi:uncharacterized protein (DUF342 family)